MASVESLTTTELTPNFDALRSALAPEAFARVRELLPADVAYPVEVRATLNGASDAVANALRRVILGEMDGVALAVSKFETTDPFVMVDYIERRVAYLPISASAKVGAEYELSVANESDAPMDVLSSALHAPRNVLFGGIIILTLQPHTMVHFVATVTRGSALTDSAFALASTAIAIPRDQRPARMRDADASAQAQYLDSVSTSDPRKWELYFVMTNKGSRPGDYARILADACESIITRVRALRGAPILRNFGQAAGTSAESDRAITEGLYVIKAEGETVTIGNLFARVCADMYPDVDLVVANMDPRAGVLDIRICMHSIDIVKFRDSVIEECARIFEHLRDDFLRE